MTVGFARRELVSLLVGLAGAGTLAVSLVWALVIRFRFFPFRVYPRWIRTRIRAGESATFDLFGGLHPVLPGGFRVFGELRFDVRRLPLVGRGLATSPSALRGVYEPSTGRCGASDPLRFFFVEQRFQLPAGLTVVVDPTTVPPFDGRAHGGIGLTDLFDPLNRNDVLVETREYHPGDDTRRLNWKTFAHTGALMVRVGEPIPPPRSRAFLVCDNRPAASRRGAKTVPGRGAELDRLDEVVATALGIAREFLVRRTPVEIIAMAGDVRATARTLDELAAASTNLSALTIADTPAPARFPQDALIVSPEGVRRGG